MTALDKSFARVTIAAAIAVLIPSLGFTAEDKPIVPPEVGQQARDFELPPINVDSTEEIENVSLAKTVEKGPVVLVVLRGYPGYQCPLCTRQVGSLIGKADELKELSATVLFIYPGSAKKLNQRAVEFMKETTLPENFALLLDPDYTFTNAYGLRWDEPKETAYPSTFVIDGKNVVRFAIISKTHGDRSDVKEVLKIVKSIEE